MLEEDRELVDRCLTGRESAYHEFVERFQGMIYGICVRMLGDRHEAEDIAQESLVRAIRNLDRWDPDKPLRPWLMTIAANRCRTCLARRRNRPVATEYTDDVPAPNTNDGELNELQAEIHAALNELRPEYRKVFLLFHEQGCSYDEMSVLIQKPVGTVKTWLHRARGELMTHLRRKGLAPEVRHDLSEV